MIFCFNWDVSLIIILTDFSKYNLYSTYCSNSLLQILELLNVNLALLYFDTFYTSFILCHITSQRVVESGLVKACFQAKANFSRAKRDLTTSKFGKVLRSKPNSQGLPTELFSKIRSILLNEIALPTAKIRTTRPLSKHLGRA